VAVLPITVHTEHGSRRVRPTAGELGELVRRLGNEDRFLVLQRVPDLPDVFMQVWHEADGDYILEYRDGTPDRHFQVLLPAPEPVVTAMTQWAGGKPGWDGAMAWQALDFGPADPPPPIDLPDSDREGLEARVRLAIAAGYETRAGLAELAEEYLVAGDFRPVSREQAAALVDRLWLERVREQEQWRGETDPERLTKAFALLEEAGIIAREDFACCRTCGLSEIGAKAPKGSRGFVFFHRQCTERAAAGAGLTLYFGGLDGTDSTTAAVGREVVSALGRAGLPAQWNGDAGSAIEVNPLRWLRRLIG
jgi:hypothetical protein